MGHFQSAVEAFQYLGDEKEEAAVSFSKAWTMRSFGDFDEALALVTQALSMDSPSDALRITSLGFKADLEAMSGQLKEAQARYQDTAKLCRARDDSYHLSAALTSLGNVCGKQNNLDDAKEHLKEALHLAKLGKRRSGGIADMRCLAALDCLRSEKEAMLRWYEDALELVSAEEATGRPGSGANRLCCATWAWRASGSVGSVIRMLHSPSSRRLKRSLRWIGPRKLVIASDAPSLRPHEIQASGCSPFLLNDQPRHP